MAALNLKKGATAPKEAPVCRQTINPFAVGGRLMLEKLDQQALDRALRSPDKEERIRAVKELGANKEALKRVSSESSCPETRFAAKAYYHAFG